MRNRKQTMFCIMAIVTLIIAFIGCDDTKEESKNQSVTLTNLFGEGRSAIVKGYLTDTEWSGVADKVETALNGAFNAGNLMAKNGFMGVFNNTVIIIVEKNPSGYTKWKTSVDGKTMYLAFGSLDNDLQGSIYVAVEKMRVPEAGFAQVKDYARLTITFLL